MIIEEYSRISQFLPNYIHYKFTDISEFGSKGTTFFVNGGGVKKRFNEGDIAPDLQHGDPSELPPECYV